MKLPCWPPWLHSACALASPPSAMAVPAAASATDARKAHSMGRSGWQGAVGLGASSWPQAAGLRAGKQRVSGARLP